MSEATQTASQEFEQTLNKTDLGHTIYEHRKSLFGLLIAILVGATAYVFWQSSKESAAMENSIKVFEFQTGVWADVKGGKSDVAALMSSYEGLSDDIRKSPSILPLSLEMSNFLYDKGNYVEADKVLSHLTELNHPIATIFCFHAKSCCFRENGKIG